ncbi:MAG: hypothetical protein ACE5H4_05665 [Candidatus Thorarchaeota archaeon]
MEDSIRAIEEVGERLDSIHDTLLSVAKEHSKPVTESSEESEAASFQILINQIDALRKVLELVELETDLLEARLSSIESLRTRLGDSNHVA